MAQTRQVALTLARQGAIEVAQRRTVVSVDMLGEIKGPVRLRLPVRDDEGPEGDGGEKPRPRKRTKGI